MPRSRPRLASSSNAIIFAAMAHPQHPGAVRFGHAHNESYAGCIQKEALTYQRTGGKALPSPFSNAGLHAAFLPNGMRLLFKQLGQRLANCLGFGMVRSYGLGQAGGMCRDTGVPPRRSGPALRLPEQGASVSSAPGDAQGRRPCWPFEDVPEVRFGLPVLSLSVKSFSDQATRQERMGMVWSAYPEFVLKKFSKIVASFLVSPLPSYGSSQLITGIQHIGVVVIGHFKPVLQQRAKVVLGW